MIFFQSDSTKHDLSDLGNSIIRLNMVLAKYGFGQIWVHWDINVALCTYYHMTVT